MSQISTLSLRTKKSSSSPQAPEIRISGAKASLNDYASLRSQVRAAINAGKIRAQDAVERERVRTAWEIGKLIHEHILLNKDRAQYGIQVLKRLSNDLNISLTELRYMVEFARTYPIHRPAGELSWSHYQALLRINDAERRKSIAEEAIKGNWTRETLRREIGKRRLSTSNSLSVDEPIRPIKGKLDTYQIVLAKEGEWKGKPVVDLGFSNYYHPSGHLSFKEGEIITSKATKSGYSLHSSRFTLNDLYTYRASLLEFVDGDTIWLLIDLGFGFSSKQRVRLRNVNAPEINSRDGQTAKKFIVRELGSSKRSTLSADRSIIITSTKDDHDQWDRYLVDVFYMKKGKEYGSARNAKVSTDSTGLTKDQYYLANELLKRELAMRI